MTTATSTTGRSVHILRRSPEAFAWPLNNALHHARLGNHGLTPEQAQQIEEFIVNMSPDDIPKIDFLLDQVILNYSNEQAPNLIRALEDIADGRRPLPGLPNYPNDIGRNREIINTPLYAWNLEDILQQVELAEAGAPQSNAAKMREFVATLPHDQQPALLRFISGAVAEHRRELADANRRMAETVRNYLEMATRDGKIPNAYR